MATAKLKSSAVDRTIHLVLIQVDGDDLEILAASREDAESLASAVIDAAAALSTVVLPLGDTGSRGYTVVGHVVLDLAKARRTTVQVQSRSLQAASMGIKK